MRVSKSVAENEMNLINFYVRAGGQSGRQRLKNQKELTPK
jgi:hypothetical protein